MKSIIKNKKGFVPIVAGAGALAVVGAFILLIIIGILVFTSINKYAVIGGGAIALTLIFGLRGDMNKTKAWFMGVVIVGGLIFIFASGSLQSISGGNYVNVPTFGYYKCEPGNEKVTTIPREISSSGSGFISCPENSDQCDVKMRIPQTSFGSNLLSDYRAVVQVCRKDGSYCSSQQYYNIAYFKNVAGYTEGTLKTNMLKSEKIFIDYQKKTILGSWNDISGSQYIFAYVPFVIYKYDTFSSRNGQQVTNENQGCVILETNNLVVSATFNLGSSNTASRLRDLTPYETRTFASKFVPISSENYGFLTYSGQDAYCIDGEIYKIEEITTGSGVYKIVGTSENKLLATKTCCPGEEKPGYYCDNNYNWIQLKEDEPIIEDVVCSAFKSCPNSLFQPYDSTTLVRYICKDNQCVQELKEVECTLNTECGGGKVCSKSSWTCVEPKGGEEETDNGDNSLCAWYQESYTTEKVDKKWYNYLGIGTPKTYTQSGCKTSTGVYIIAGILGAVILGIVFILSSKRKPKRRKRR